MKTALIFMAASIAAVALAAPVHAQSWSASSHGDRHHGGDRFDHRGDHRHRADTVILDSYGGEWALYNNRTWEADSYNDWWHDRPDRAYPRWMSRNQDCARQWYSGDTLRC